MIDPQVVDEKTLRLLRELYENAEPISDEELDRLYKQPLIITKDNEQVRTITKKEENMETIQAIQTYEREERPTAITLIESVDLTRMERQIRAISDFQELVHLNFKQGHDYGVIPGTGKPTMLKPGAEKLIQLLGLKSEFNIIDMTRDFEKGFFQYQVKCILKHKDDIITEGLGSCNTKERKYIRQDPYTMDNTVLKMAKKRALVDAALMVGALSDIFTQDIEDMDLNGQSYRVAKRTYTDRDGAITHKQAQDAFDAAGEDKEIVQAAMKELGYQNSKEIQKIDYARFMDLIRAKVAEKKDAAAEGKDAPEEDPTKTTEEDPPIGEIDDLVDDFPDFLKDASEEEEA